MLLRSWFASVEAEQTALHTLGGHVLSPYAPLAIAPILLIFWLPAKLTMRRWVVLSTYRVDVPPKDRLRLYETGNWLSVALDRTRFSSEGESARRQFLWSAALWQVGVLADVAIVFEVFLR